MIFELTKMNIFPQKKLHFTNGELKLSTRQQKVIDNDWNCIIDLNNSLLMDTPNILFFYGTKSPVDHLSLAKAQQ